MWLHRIIMPFFYRPEFFPLSQNKLSKLAQIESFDNCSLSNYYSTLAGPRVIFAFSIVLSGITA